MKGKNQKASKTLLSENWPFSQSIIDLHPEDSQKQMSQILMSDTRNVISWDGNCKIYWGNLNLNFKEWIKINPKKIPCASSFDIGTKIRGEKFYRFINWSFTFSHPRLSCPCPVQTWWCTTIFKTFLSIVQPLGRLWTWPWPWPWQSTKIMVKEMTQQFENMKPNDHRWRLFMQNRSQLSILAPDQSRRKETQARPMAILLCIPSLNITRPHSTSSCCPVYQWTLPTFKFHYKKDQSCKVHKSKKTTKLKHDGLEEFRSNRIFDVALYIQNSRRPDHGSPSSFNCWGAFSFLTSSLFSLGFFVLIRKSCLTHLWPSSKKNFRWDSKTSCWTATTISTHTRRSSWKWSGISTRS